MAKSPPPQRVTPLSLKINVGLMLLHLAAVAVIGGFLLWSSWVTLGAVRAHLGQIMLLTQELRRLDQQCGESIALAAETGDAKWREQFGTAQRRLDADIHQAVEEADALAPESELCRNIERNIGIASVTVEEARRRLLADIAEGRTEDAATRLASPEYRAMESSYDQKVQLLAETLSGLVRESLDSLRMKTIQGAGILSTMVLGLSLLIAFATRIYQRHSHDRTEVEAALRESEERFRALIENIPVGVYRLKPGRDGGFMAANPTMAKMFGYENVSSFLRLNPMDLYADHAARRAFSDRLRREGSVVGEELRLRRSDGALIWGRISANLVRDENGEILYVDGIDEDITERKAAAEAMQESERRYRLLAENARDVIWTADMNLRLTYVSPSIEALRGYGAEETVSQGLDGVLTRESMRTAQRALSESIADAPTESGGSQAKTIELEVICKDGRTIWTETKISFQRDEARRPIGIQGSMRDISQRRQAEEALRRSEQLHRGITETADEGIWVLDADNRTSFANAKMAQMLGVELDALIGKSILEFVDGAGRTQFERDDQARRRGERTHGDLPLIRAGRSPFWAYVAATPMYGRDGSHAGTLAMITDITERKRAEEAIRRSEEAYRLLAENSRDVIWTLDRDLRLTYVSPSARALVNVTSDEALGKSIEDVLAPTSAAIAREALGKELTRVGRPGGDPGQTLTLELELVRKDATTVWTEMNISFIRDGSGRVTGVQGSARDISERRGAREALRQSEELYRGIVETADEGVWIVDTDRRTVFVNQKMAEMLGYEPPEMLGRASTEFMDEESAAISASNHELRLKGIRTHTDFRLRRKNGSDLWVIVSAAPRFDAEGGYAGTLGMFTDITDRKRAEEGSKILAAISSLFLSGKDLEMAINTVLEMCGRFDRADRAYVFHLTEDGRCMSNTHEWCNEGIRPFKSDLQNLPASEFTWLLDQLRRGQSVIIPDVGKIPGGLRDHLARQDIKSLVCFPIFIDGSFEAFCGFDAVKAPREWSSSDVSVLRQTAELIARGIERRRAENAIRNSETLYTSLVEHLPQSVFRKDREGKHTFVNSTFCQLLGRKPREIIGRTNFDLFPAKIAQILSEEDERVLRTGETSEDVIDFDLPGGEKIDLHIAKTAVRDAHGEVVGLQGIALDVTERRKAEEATRAAARMEATATLAGGIAHDFNNLMVGIQGNADLLRMDFDGKADVMRKLNVIASSARRGGELAHQLLAFARGGKVRAVLMSLADGIREALHMQERSFGPGIKVESDIAPDLWLLEADPTQMGQVVMNLALNAAEAIGATGGTITVKAENRELNREGARAHPGLKPGPHILLSVRDTGSGMSEETMAKVFEPFFTTKFQGRGLGLAAIYGIVRNHGGHIEVESKLGEGSTFRVWLPAKPDGSLRATKPQMTAPPKGTETILLVDDEPMILEVTHMMLERLGYKVLTASDGQKALEVVAAHTDGPIHLAILDLEMPVMDGPQTLSRLRESHPETKVLLCSGHPRDTRARGLMEKGAVGYLIKPFRMDALAQEVRRAIDGKK